MDKDEQALLLLTNRLLMDWISIAVDSGQVSLAGAESLIDFSAAQVVQGAPWLDEQVAAFASAFKDRLPKPGEPSPLA